MCLKLSPNQCVYDMHFLLLLLLLLLLLFCVGLVCVLRRTETLRASFCKYRESRDSFKIFNFFVFCSNRPFSELFSKTRLKHPNALQFFSKVLKSPFWTTAVVQNRVKLSDRKSTGILNFKAKLQWCSSLHLGLCCVKIIPAAQQKCPNESQKRQVNFWHSSHFLQEINVT